MRGGPPEVALGAVLVDAELDTSCGILGALCAVDLECVDVGVGGIVGLVQVLDLDLCSLLEGLSCFPV